MTLVISQPLAGLDCIDEVRATEAITLPMSDPLKSLVNSDVVASGDAILLRISHRFLD